MAAGHIPTKITMNKYGGGGMDFGFSPKSPPVHGYRPVPGPSMDHTDYNRPLNQFSAPQQPPQFNQPAAPAPAVHRPPPQHSKPAPSFGRPRQGEAPISFGVDYTKPHTMRQQPKQQKPQRERPPAVNARRPDDETDYSWGNTLRGDGRNLKPWEAEAMEAQKYQNAPVDSPYRPHMAPATAPATAPKPQLSPHTGGQSGQQQKPVQQGDRDWNDSYVYQMIHSSDTTSSSMQTAPGQPPQGQSVTTTRVTQESKYPGQAPQRHVTETVQRGGPGGYVFDNAIGMSDF